MRRIPFLLVAVTGALMLVSGPAIAAAGRTVASPPVSTALPTIAGMAQKGQTLTAANGTWTGLAPIAYTYDWQRCSAAGSGCKSIGQATNQNYVASNGDVDGTIRVQVTATNADGKAEALSAPTAKVVDSGTAPANTKQPNPTGSATAGQTIKVDNGNWSGAKPITFTYQWQSCTSQACADIAGMTGSSLLIGTAQIGSTLRAMVTASNATGKTSASSNLTAAVLAAAGAPANTFLPAITGPRSVGQTLHASTGTWTAAPSSFGYQWTRCNSNGSGCAAVSGATGQTYGVGSADQHMAIRVNVTATNKTGSTTATSASVAIGTVFSARFGAVLRTGQELRRPNGTTFSSTGHFTAKVTGKTLRWTLTYTHLTGRPTVAHLNKGVRGTNGIAFKSLCYRCSTPASGTLTLTASQLDSMLRGKAYVNVQTKRNPMGEIRGQIGRVS